MFFSDHLVPSLNLGGRIVSLERPIVMGILNVTPDSFYDGGQYTDTVSALKHVEQMLDDGALIIDVGAMSSRPFAMPLSEEDELSRIQKIFPELVRNFPNAFFSIDTYRSEVARVALEHGAVMVNDISAFNLDPVMPHVVSQFRAAYVLMHMLGTPQDMQINPQYSDVLSEVYAFFTHKLDTLFQYRIHDIIIDLGFGFGKSVSDNYRLLRELPYFATLERPILLGISRKSMIYQPLKIKPEQALNGTTALHMYALTHGVHILRAHDVKAAVEAIKLYALIHDLT